MLKKTFDQLCLVIANLLAHYVLKIGNNWLYKGYWQGKAFPKICEKNFFSGLPAEFFFITWYAGNKYIFFCGLKTWAKCFTTGEKGFIYTNFIICSMQIYENAKSFTKV